jgi:hypothetical protein
VLLFFGSLLLRFVFASLVNTFWSSLFQPSPWHKINLYTLCPILIVVGVRALAETFFSCHEWMKMERDPKRKKIMNNRIQFQGV